MTDAAGSTARSTAERVRSTPAFRVAARSGFALSGLLNLMIGVLAITIAVAGGSGTDADAGGALASLAGAPGGLVLIWLIAIGTAALGLWMLAESMFERDADRTDRWKARAKDIGKGIAYLAIAATAIGTAVRGGGGSGGGGAEESLTARALGTPGGVILVVALGLGVIGIGGYLVAKGARRRFLDDLTAPAGAMRTPVTVIGVLGYVARGIAFGAIGVLLVVAAVTSDSAAAGGLDDALAALAALPFGKVLLVAIGLGFIAAGLYGAVRARYAKL